MWENAPQISEILTGPSQRIVCFGPLYAPPVWNEPTVVAMPCAAPRWRIERKPVCHLPNQWLAYPALCSLSVTHASRRSMSSESFALSCSPWWIGSRPLAPRNCRAHYAKRMRVRATAEGRPCSAGRALVASTM